MGPQAMASEEAKLDAEMEAAAERVAATEAEQTESQAMLLEARAEASTKEAAVTQQEKNTALRALVTAQTVADQADRCVSSLVILEGGGGQSLVIEGSSLVILEGKACNPL